MSTQVTELDTPAGLARVHVRRGSAPRAALVLGHGAGGGVGARDLVTVADVAEKAGCTVVLVEQPYRVAGRRTPPRAPQLDSAWITILEQLEADVLAGVPLVAGGRSSGARVACRPASATGAAAVLCLAFPLRPPRRSGEAPSRLPELDAVHVPTLVVQGARDPFGIPPAAPGRRVVQVASDHGLRTDLQAVAAAVSAWLGEVLPQVAATPIR